MAKNWFERWFHLKPTEDDPAVPPGLYHALRASEGRFTRFHLRVERDGRGMLIANARAAATLSPSGVRIVKGLLDGETQAQIVKDLKRRFRGAAEATVLTDIEKVNGMIRQIESPGDTYPVFNLEDAAVSPYDTALIAPLQASLPIGDAEQMLPLLSRLWGIGIPHVTFLASEGFAPADAIRAVERAEDLGMIAGIRGRASDLNQGTFMGDIAQAGIDHVTFLYANSEPILHDVLCGDGDHAAASKLLAWLEENQICAVAEVPLLQSTLYSLDTMLPSLLSMGADNFTFVALVSTEKEPSQRDGVFHADAMPQVATLVEEAAHEVNARFIWNPPVQRDPGKTVAQQVREGPRCSGDVAVRVELNGDIIPARGPYMPAGNLLADTWDSIWNHEVFLRYRERVQSSTRCDVCPGLAICAADCPRDPRGWALAKQA